MPIDSSYSSPTGTVTPGAEDLFLEGGPNFWIGGVCRECPDDDDFYWGITGTEDNPVYLIGCYEDFRFRDNITMNDIQCDTVGVQSTTQKRNYLEVTFTLKSLLPFQHLTRFMKGGGVTDNAAEGTSKFGLGEVNNDTYYMCYWSRVYDDTTGDFVSVTGHRCQVVDAFELATVWGQPWTLTGFVVRFYADNTKPDDQLFATIIRYDPSVI